MNLIQLCNKEVLGSPLRTSRVDLSVTMQLSGEWFRWSEEESDDDAQPVLMQAASHRSRTGVSLSHHGAAWFRWSEGESEDEAQPMVMSAGSQMTRTDLFPNHLSAAAPDSTAAAEESLDRPSRAYAAHNRIHIHIHINK